MDIKDKLEVRIAVQLGFVVTLGVYSGPITREMLGEHIEQMLDATHAHEFIDRTEIIGVTIDEHEQVLTL